MSNQTNALIYWLNICISETWRSRTGGALGRRWWRLAGDDKGPPTSGGKRRLLGSLFPREEFLVTLPGQPLHVRLLPSRQGPACTGRGSGPLPLPAKSLPQLIPFSAQCPSPDPTARSSGDRRQESLHLAVPSDQNILSGEDTALHWLFPRQSRVSVPGHPWKHRRK